MRVVQIVQARMASTRLPGKILRTVLGKPLLEYQIERLMRSGTAGTIGVATTGKPADDPVVALCRRLGVRCYRGSEEDVLGRYHGAATVFGADAVVRVTSDCPLIDPAVLDRVVSRFLQGKGAFDYVSNTLHRTYPRGLDVEVFSYAALAEANREADLPAEREHVTPFLYRRPERYRLANVACDVDLSNHRWTVDTPEDFRFVETILADLYPRNPEFRMIDVLALLAANPGWKDINAGVEQKSLES